MRGFKDAISGEHPQPTVLATHQQQPIDEVKSAARPAADQIPAA